MPNNGPAFDPLDVEAIDAIYPPQRYRLPMSAERWAIRN